MGPRRSTKMIGPSVLPLVTLVAVLVFSTLRSCSTSQTASGEILIALKPEAISLLNHSEELDPFNTGVPSLDALNRKWDVAQMVRVFPDLSPDDEAAARYGLAGIFKLLVPGGTDLAAMIRDYRSDPQVDYAELNHPYEIK